MGGRATRGAGKLQFDPATGFREADAAAVQRRVRHEVPRLFEGNGLLNPEAAENMRLWGHGGGFSLHGSATVEVHDRAAFECLLRYYARPAFSVLRLSWCLPFAI
jgi:hypothetical protein